MDDATAEHSPAPDAALLAGLKGRHGAGWRLFLVVLWIVWTVGEGLQGHPFMAALGAVASIAWGWTWWVGPLPTLREVTDDALLVRQGLRTRSIARSQVEDVRASYSSGYGLVLALRGADPVTLAGTAPRHSVAAAQAGALRRWAGLE